MTDDYVLEYKQFKDIDLNDPFFDSLKKDYKEFEVWFLSNSDRYAYVQYDENHLIESFLYFKLEYNMIDDVNPIIYAERILKIGTFKVNAHGTKLGERFIKKSLDFAICNNVDVCYVTVFEHQESLIKLLQTYGFIHKGEKVTKNGKELVLVKDLNEFGNDVRAQYPLINSKNHNKYILSVYPKYHTMLFPDSILNNESVDILEDVSHTNSINKIYVSRMYNLRSVKKGDILVIYRTADTGRLAKYSSVVTSVCVVEEVKVQSEFKNFEEFYEYANRYSVFDKNDLLYWYTQGGCYVIKMTYNIALSKRLIREKLIDDFGISAYDYWGFMKLTDSQFNDIITYGGANKRYIR